MSTRSPLEPLAKVLIIEDEKTLAEMIAAYLARSGYQTAVEHDASPEYTQHESSPQTW